MTTTKTKPITKATVQKELRRIKRENPDALNPMDADKNSCLYHKGRGRNIRRCIIGQLGYELGLPTPPADLGGVSKLTEDGGPWEGLFTEAAVDYMSDVQWDADGDYASKYMAKPWGTVKL
jgi:hypothetical protein